MEQRDGSTMNSLSGNKSPSSHSPSQSPSDAMNKKAETSSLNPSGKPFLTPTNTPGSGEAQSSSSNLSPISSPSVATESSQPPNASGVSNPKTASDCGDDEIPISSMASPGSAIQNPPLQVMERAEERDTPSAYKIPSHVFDRTKSNTPEWSTASNESLFSIHVGNMSFSRELNWLNSEMNMSGPLPPPNQSPVSKFNDISQSAGEFHEGFGVTEAKAAETMREVIMETTAADYDLTSVSATARVDGWLANFHDHSHHSDGSTKSFAFKVRTDGDKSPTRSPKGVNKEKPMQQMQTMTETETAGTPKETPKNAADQATSATSNASACNKWLCCFACCK